MISSSGCNGSTTLAYEAALLPLLAMVAVLVVVVDAGKMLGYERPQNPNPLSRTVGIDNQSGRKIEMYWVNVFKEPNDFVPQFMEDGVQVGCSYGADKTINSFSGHQFEIREVPSKKTKKCVFNECRKVRIKISDRKQQTYTINRDFTISIEDDTQIAYSKANDIFQSCKAKVALYTTDPLEIIDLVSECMMYETNAKLVENSEERSFHSKKQREMAADLIPYACGDVNKTETQEIVNQTWTYIGNNGDPSKPKPKNVHLLRTLHKLPTSDIFAVSNFASQDTCDALKIYRQELSGSDGEGSTIGIPTSATQEPTKQGKLLLELFYKIYALLNDNFPHWKDLSEFFDDTLFGYLKDPVGLELPSHLCQGIEEVAEAFAALEAEEPKKCQIPGGEPSVGHTKRTVVGEDTHPDLLAQVFLFCDEPKDKLGGLHFPYAGVHATPEVGKLVVAVHRHNTDDNKQQKLDGYTEEYHLCPNHELYVHTVSTYGDDDDDDDEQK